MAAMVVLAPGRGALLRSAGAAAGLVPTGAKRRMRQSRIATFSPAERKAGLPWPC